MHAECDEPYTERNKVETMISKVQCKEADIRSAVTTICMSDTLSVNFVDAANKLSETISAVFPSVQLRNTRCQVSSATTGRGGGRGGGRHGRGRGRGPFPGRGPPQGRGGG